MIELLGLLVAALGSVFCSRRRLILENLLLRQQLQVVRSLIATMVRESPHWGPSASAARCSSTASLLAAAPCASWRTFVADHAHTIWAADLFVVQILTFPLTPIDFEPPHSHAATRA